MTPTIAAPRATDPFPRKPDTPPTTALIPVTTSETLTRFVTAVNVLMLLAAISEVPIIRNNCAPSLISSAVVFSDSIITLGETCGVGAGDGGGVTVHGIKLGNCVTFAGGGGVALTIGLGPGAADALFILSSDPPPTTREITMVRIISFSFPFKVIPNDYGQKYFF